MQSRSIKRKLFLIYLLTIIPALLLAGGAFIIQDIYSIKQTLNQKIVIQSRIIASNASIAILFKDHESATEILQALQADPEILSARIVIDQQTFVHYRRPHIITTPAWLLNQFLDPLFILNSPVTYKDKTIAEIEIVSDYPGLHQHFRQYGSVTILVMISVFLISLIIATRLQKAFLAPIKHLVNITKKVAQDQNYTIKVSKTTHDELGILAENFNLMLEQINERDKNLEKIVDNRTTELINLNETLNYRATHDSLTNLANRQLFNDRVSVSILQAERLKKNIAILFLDLDHFKLINDTKGHTFGDLILCQAADRLSLCTRKTDTLARMGGDEFTILLNHINSADSVVIYVEKVLNAFKPPFIIENHEFHVKPSIGISLYPDDGIEIDILQKNADTAMYSAKKEGGNRYHFFSSKMSEDVQKRMTLEAELHIAMKQKQMLLYYQPQINRKGKLISFEALIRWSHPSKGMISPDDFIPVAEETGQIIELGAWVIEQACKQQVLWKKQGYTLLPIHINISPKQFLQPNLAHDIQIILQIFGLSPHLIGCEITENTFASNIEQSTAILKKLEKFGIHLSIDDFGTGYSSLGYLKSFPIHSLKIDQVFIKGMSMENKDAALVKGIINLAHSLNLSVVAEGVETAKQQAFLIQHQCDVLQGYYFSKPLPAEQAAIWLKNK